MVKEVELCRNQESGFHRAMAHPGHFSGHFWENQSFCVALKNATC